MATASGSRCRHRRRQPSSRRSGRSSGTARSGNGCPAGFDPQRALGTPRSVAALLGPNPRVIADATWAKLLWADLNLQIADLPEAQSGHFYPFELVRAITLTWLLSGQRSDEIIRLRVGLHPLAAPGHADRRGLTANPGPGRGLPA
jgi:hypothetical protein